MEGFLCPDNKQCTINKSGHETSSMEFSNQQCSLQILMKGEGTNDQLIIHVGISY